MSNYPLKIIMTEEEYQEIKETAKTINRVIDTETEKLREQRDKLWDTLKGLTYDRGLMELLSRYYPNARDRIIEAIVEAKKEV